jgi:hypothetical protein
MSRPGPFEPRGTSKSQRRRARPAPPAAASGFGESHLSFGRLTGRKPEASAGGGRLRFVEPAGPLAGVPDRKATDAGFFTRELTTGQCDVRVAMPGDPFALRLSAFAFGEIVFVLGTVSRWPKVDAAGRAGAA